MTAMTATRNGWKPRDFVRDDRVHRNIYTNPEIFELEMERIFERVWVYIGHESQVRDAGDFFCTTIGRQPVVMVRHQDEQVYVLYNRCGHRAALVCNEDRGNTRYFRCSYHGWTFRTNGELAGAPMRNGYPKDFDWTAPELGMVQLPRVAKYGGFVFASMAPDGPDLESYLGPMTTKIDDVLNLSPEGEIELVGGALKYGYRANWKLQLDNAMDLYHPPYSHESTSSNDGRQFTRRVGDEREFRLSRTAPVPPRPTSSTRSHSGLSMPGTPGAARSRVTTEPEPEKYSRNTLPPSQHATAMNAWTTSSIPSGTTRWCTRIV